MQLQVGEIVGDYRLSRNLYDGPKSEVWEAVNANGSPSVKVAIKFLRRDYARDEVERERFKRQVVALSKLDHDNVVRLHRWGDVHRGFPYIVMQFVGPTLKNHIREKGHLSFQEAYDIVEQVADALDSCHKHGIVHRDIKPQNIGLEEQPGGRQKAVLYDFGIAKTEDRGVTVDGEVLGTPDYMSPEQIRGLTLDGRSDQYSLAIVLWELLTGHVPFQGQGHYDTIRHHLESPPPVLRIPDAGKTSQEYLLANSALRIALAKERDDRFRSCREFVEAARPKSAPQPVPDSEPDGTETIDIRPVTTPTLETSQEPAPTPKPHIVIERPAKRKKDREAAEQEPKEKPERRPGRTKPPEKDKVERPIPEKRKPDRQPPDIRRVDRTDEPPRRTSVGLIAAVVGGILILLVLAASMSGLRPGPTDIKPPKPDKAFLQLADEAQGHYDKGEWAMAIADYRQLANKYGSAASISVREGFCKGRLEQEADSVMKAGNWADALGRYNSLAILYNKEATYWAKAADCESNLVTGNTPEDRKHLANIVVSCRKVLSISQTPAERQKAQRLSDDARNALISTIGEAEADELIRSAGG